MALTVKSSFSSGELDPVLHERTTLEKYKKGLATARNVMVGKTGSILSRHGRKHYVQTNIADSAVVGYSPPGSGYLIEWGHEYVRVYDNAGAIVATTAHYMTAADIPNLQFETSKEYVYIFFYGNETLKLNWQTGAFDTVLSGAASPTNVSVTPTGAPAGYALDYAITAVRAGQESLPVTFAGGSLPIAAGQSNAVDVRVQTGTVNTSGVTEIRVYRRPVNGGAFGFIGSSSYIYSTGANLHATLTDLGQSADYSHSPPAQLEVPNAPNLYGSKTGTVYQQRLILSWDTDPEAILCSRPGYQNNFFRDFPYSSDSSLKLKAGSGGSAEILRMIDSDGLVVFTTRGIFLHSGEITPTNLALVKKCKNVVAEQVGPLAVPGGVLFIDKATNSVRNLVWSQELASFNAEEVSIFSAHLFLERRVESMGFHEGAFPVLFTQFNDGDFALFTYEFDQEMKAWTRADSSDEIVVEQVIQTEIPELTYFLVRKGTTRYFEKTVPRVVSAATLEADPEAYMGEAIAFMDSMVTYNGLLNGSLVGADVFTLAPVTPGDWEGSLTLTCGTSAIFTSPGPGAVGEILRVFDSDKTAYDLEVTARASNNSITVTPSTEFPSDLATTSRIYRTTVSLTGLAHLNDEDVSVVVDGYVVASPKNDIEGYPVLSVTAGGLTLPSANRAAIAHIGRPIIGDVETLDVDTVEQAPTLIESITCDKVHVKVQRSSGLYIGNKFPLNDFVAGDEPNELPMRALDTWDVDYADTNPIIGNRFQQPATKRYQITLPGDWKSQGRVCFRQVDPLHFQILSIIPDLEVHRRSDR